MKRLLNPPRTAALLAGSVALLIYLLTLAPAVGFIDSGELAAVASTLGIAHPTGYPLFTLLGRLFTRLPLGGEEIVRLNTMAALFCAAAVAVLTLVLVRLLELVVSGRRLRFLRGPASGGAFAFCGAGGALLLGFSETFWATAVSVEVYSLHLLLLSLTLLTFLKAAFPDAAEDGRRNPPGVPGSERWWMVFALLLGLGFTNHMTTILLGPGFFYLYFATQGWGPRAWKRIAAMAGPFLLGLSVYLYLPIRAGQVPSLNWGNPVTLERFLWHLSGKQYRVWIFSSTEAAGRQLTYFLSTLSAEFAFVGIPLALVGFVLLWRAHRPLALWSLLLFTGCVLYAVNYDIHDIDSYFLLAYVVVALWAAVAMYGLYVLLRSSMRLPTVPAGGGMLLPAVIALVMHFGRADESGNRLVEDYTMNMFASFRPDALVFSYQWDYWVSASYYYQLVRGIRPDVTVVDKELLRRSWYFAELEQRYPWLIRGSRREIDAFLAELSKFEHELPYDPAVIEARYVGMITHMIRKGMETRPVYVTHEIESQFTQGLQRVPEGLAFRVHDDTVFHPTPKPDFRYRPFGRQGRLEDQVPRIYAGALNARAAYYYYRAGEGEDAVEALREALRIHPGNSESLRLLGLVAGEGRH